MSTEIQLREVEGVQFYTDEQGDAGISQSGLAILCGVPRNTINDYLARVRPGNTKKAGKLTSTESELSVINAKIVDADTCVTAIEYYAFEAKINHDKALGTFRKFAKIGFTKWVQSITGFEPSQPSELKVILSDIEATRALLRLQEEKANTIAYLGDKPGLAAKMALSQLTEQKAIEGGLLIFDELCDLVPIPRMENGMKSKYSAALAGAWANDNQRRPERLPRPGKNTPCHYPPSAVETLRNTLQTEGYYE